MSSLKPVFLKEKFVKIRKYYQADNQFDRENYKSAYRWNQRERILNFSAFNYPFDKSFFCGIC